MIRRRSETRTRRLVLVTAGMAVLGIAVFYHRGLFISHAQDPNGKVSHTTNGNTEVWKIDTPNVKQAVTPYPQIRFKPGDRIALDAGGCVQTGGVGDTWKRYVNPSGPDADKKYYGLIWIPGVIGGPAAGGVPPTPQRFLGHLGPNETVIVPSGVDVNQLFLRLGYIEGCFTSGGSEVRWNYAERFSLAA